MRRWTDQRNPETPDELWLLEHTPVFTLGQAGRLEYLRDSGTIPVVVSDRGGQITYHGPGQLVVYSLLDLNRLGLGIRGLVASLEAAVVDLLRDLGLSPEQRPRAPGVYVEGAKIAALGLRVRRGCSYHGLSLNIAMDLEPFRHIDPCGYPGLAVTQLCDLGIIEGVMPIANRLVNNLQTRWGHPGLVSLPRQLPPDSN